MTDTMRVRDPAVAGMFYPDDPRELSAYVDQMLRRPGKQDGGTEQAAPPKALIVPHAGYVYSGPVAGTGYASLKPLRGTVNRVVLLGPAHRVPLHGLAVPSVDAMRTPLGLVPVDQEGRRAVVAHPDVVVDDGPHQPEHSLEVHLPFLQRTLGDVAVLPLVVGEAGGSTVADVLDLVWGGPETLIVVSSDLSHFHDYRTAAALDRETADLIAAGDVDAVGTSRACGAHPVRGLLLAARRHHLLCRVLDLRNSGDTAGPRDRVVGYGAFAFGPFDPGSAGKPRAAP